jgi:predicted DNA-binding protein YlxM (UPF0122 family)
MTQDQINIVKGYLIDGYDLNRVAAIMMISRTELEKSIVETPTKKAKVEDKPLFEDEPGL